jgi:hypothetical protein
MPPAAPGGLFEAGERQRGKHRPGLGRCHSGQINQQLGIPRTPVQDPLTVLPVDEFGAYSVLWSKIPHE